MTMFAGAKPSDGMKEVVGDERGAQPFDVAESCEIRKIDGGRGWFVVTEVEDVRGSVGFGELEGWKCRGP